MQALKAFLLRKLTQKKKCAFDPSRIKTIVVFRYDRIGDLIVSLPLLQSLHHGFPDAKINVITSKVNDCIASICPFIQGTLVKPKRVISWLHVLLTLRTESIDLVIDLNHAVAPHTLFATLIINPKHVASPYKDGRWNVKGTDLELFDLMPARHPDGYDRPISQTYLDIARLLDCPITSAEKYPLPTLPRPKNIPDKYIVLNYRGSRENMQLPVKDITHILTYVHTQHPDFTIVIPAMIGDHEGLLHLTKPFGGVRILPPTATIEPLLPAIQHATLVITPDTAIVHLACAYAVRLISIYTADEALFQQWQPINQAPTTILRSQASRDLIGYCKIELIEAIDQHLQAVTHTWPNSRAN
jgi:ADP-heptose:LPS heptosyltransferase